MSSSSSGLIDSSALNFWSMSDQYDIKKAAQAVHHGVDEGHSTDLAPGTGEISKILDCHFVCRANKTETIRSR